MQWDASPFAGFSTKEPWLPVTADYATRNVAAERADPTSLYNLHRHLIALRRQHAALKVGSYKPIKAEGDLLAYLREKDGERFLVALNLGSRDATLMAEPGTIAISVLGGRDGQRVRRSLTVAGNEGLVIKLD
jgi:alpha-glucosidase